ncbi:MAG: sugar ABC transporter ATP-binding protein, partial [bacterium]
MVHQDYHLFPQLSVAENVFGLSTRLPRHRLTRTVDRGAMRKAVTHQLEQLGVEISPTVPAGTLDPAERKFIEIARAMLRKPRFLILDEPTASLEPQASQAVLDLLDRLRNQRVGLCLISHRLDEVLDVSDVITVLRDGRRIARHKTSELDEAALVKLIVSEEGGIPAPPKRPRLKESNVVATPALKVSDLALRPGVKPISFEIRPGEVFGLSGLLGAGPSKITRLIAGAGVDGVRWGSDGEIEIGGQRARIRSPADATKCGIGYIPEDRKRLGLVPEASVATNIALASLDGVSRFGLLNKAAIARQAKEAQAAMSIRCASTAASVRTLSGGNQQKVLIARWISSGCKVLAVEEPTHGVDVGGKAQILQLLRDFADQGGAIGVASTEARERLERCDRI